MTNATNSQFDSLATLYEDMATWPFRRDIEIPSVLEAIGEVAGQDVLDFGCGDGTYSRMLKQRGARTVVGFDESEGMLQHARNRESKDRLGISFVSKLDPKLDRQFDLVLGVYVLPYASNRQALEQMCSSMKRLIRPGGRLVTLPVHPEYVADPAYYRPYGFSLTQNPPHEDGGAIELELFHSGYNGTVTAWYWSAASLNAALQTAGFEQIAHLNPLPKALVPIERAPELLRAYLSKPHAVILRCQ
ncbi:class I SAM-dependent methyltransferase [Achromobacter sp. NPDC058515]|uniref:class I SAM-dependent methyltransferase n=1 Tax=Achromobacter sp. NPDC058515 TaxID=3346533 RepID=UPI00364A31E2